MAEKTKKEDRRIRYTKKVIKETFLKLLEKNSFAKITVTELCRMAEINRGTFYLHYYDMEDVLDDILEDMLSDTSSVMEHVLSQK
ncbi:MAG: TetR/AcrR family transcriptional regulator, partial [Lachnospiraceae bacterium]|nr:TetR/AcrR family transcriptional regulator [Lachnospiraceae bacterium]